MCGRFARFTPAERIAELIQARCEVGELAPRYNILPGQSCLTCRMSADGERELALMRWPYIPPFEPRPGTRYATINARAEALAGSRLWQFPFRHFRCLIAADGFYEPLDTGEKRKPQYFFRRRDGEPFFMAGLWSRWEPAQAGAGEAFDSCTIITTAPNSLVSPIHPRMPAIVPPAAWAAWLDPQNSDPRQLQGLLRPAPAADWAGYPVGYYTREDAPRVIERVE